MNKFRRATQIVNQLDWVAVYQDYLNSGYDSLLYYYQNYFKSFCASCGITDLMISKSTFYRHMAQFTSQPLQQSNKVEPPAVASEATDEGNKFSSDESDHTSSMQEQVAVFDLETLMATAPAAGSGSSLCSDGAQVSKRLVIEWSGMKFSYPCLDPGRSLASLLFRLRKLEEAHHAY